MIPRYLILRKTTRNGRRLPKRTMFFQPIPDYSKLPGVYKPSLPPGPSQIAIVSDGGEMFDKDMDFKNWEFRFWGIDGTMASGMNVAVCRCCEDIEQSRDLRFKHHKDAGCTVVLLDAFKLLLKDMRCVMCDKKTFATKFGVPMCVEPGCLDKWKFEAQPKALYDAIQLVHKGVV